jgi:hypothetical protein
MSKGRSIIELHGGNKSSLSLDCKNELRMISLFVPESAMVLCFDFFPCCEAGLIILQVLKNSDEHIHALWCREASAARPRCCGGHWGRIRRWRVSTLQRRCRFRGGNRDTAVPRYGGAVVWRRGRGAVGGLPAPAWRAVAATVVASESTRRPRRQALPPLSCQGTAPLKGSPLEGEVGQVVAAATRGGSGGGGGGYCPRPKEIVLGPAELEMQRAGSLRQGQGAGWSCVGSGEGMTHREALGLQGRVGWRGRPESEFFLHPLQVCTLYCNKTTDRCNTSPSRFQDFYTKPIQTHPSSPCRCTKQRAWKPARPRACRAGRVRQQPACRSVGCRTRKPPSWRTKQSESSGERAPPIKNRRLNGVRGAVHRAGPCAGEPCFFPAAQRAVG